MKISSILGLNARAAQFSYNYNSLPAKKRADSKIQTARVLKRADILTPKIYQKLRKPEDLIGFAWEDLPSCFVIKPSRGLGGEGIVIIKKKLTSRKLTQHVWVTSQKQRLTQEDLNLHSLDIIEGAYSLGNIPDVALVQESVGRHKIFRRFAYRGTPDIRVIVFNKVPVMAMLRLPTKVSGGRANLHQGALGVGIDMATGITTKAIWFGKVITHKPGTNRKLQGIKIPNWTSTLALAVTAQIASGLGYVGIDILYHPEKGQMVLEINAEPGLEIQLANMAGLKKRLERVEDLEVVNSEHGVKIAKALFSSGLVAKARTEEEPITVEVFEEIKIRTNSTKYKVKAKLDTGAWRSSIDKGLAEKLGLLAPDNILWTKKVKSSLGIEERSIINLTFYLKGKKVTTAAGLANRSNLRTSVIIGRRDLAGFLVKPVN